DVALLAVFRVLEAEAALQPEPPVRVPAQAQAVGVHALVEPDHPGRLAGAAADDRGTFGRGAGGVPPRIAGGTGNHQRDQGREVRHGGNVAQRRTDCNRRSAGGWGRSLAIAVCERGRGAGTAPPPDQAGGGPSLSDRSIACRCLVSPPIEMQSTPSSAIARTPSRSTPPDTSSGILPSWGAPWAIRTASRRVAASKSSIRMRSQPATSASRSWSSVSTSTISGRAGCAARAAAIAAATEPNARTWFSLS